MRQSLLGDDLDNLIVQVTTKLDLHSAGDVYKNVIARELEGHVAGGGECHLLLDFTNVKYLNSVELGTLIDLHKQIRAVGGQLTLFNLDAQLRELFSLTRLDTLLAVCREEDPDAGQTPE